jgi:retron-type reverse transcriptase
MRVRPFVCVPSVFDIAEGHGRVADLDLEKFFDQVNHDRLLRR